MAAPGASLRVEFDLRELERVTGRLVGLLEDYTVPLQACGDVLMDSVRQNFTRQGRPRWQQLSPLTLFLRRQGRGGGEAQTLMESGHLMQSVVFASQGVPGAVYEITPTTLKIGSNLKYAAIHQYGGVVKAKYAGVLARRIGPEGLVVTQKGALRKKWQAPEVADRLHVSGGAWIIFGKSVKIPARPYLVVQPPDLEEFGQEFARWAQTEFDRMTGGA